MTDLALLGGQPALPSDCVPAWPEHDDAERRALLDTLDSGKWWMYAYGSEELAAGDDEQLSQVETFERAFAAAHRVKHCITVSSGSCALDVCMAAIDLKPGDEVITTPYTFFATSLCVLNRGAVPVYVDIDPKSYNIDPNRIEDAITPRTRAILPVHFAGEICDMDAINDIAKRHNLVVVEDAAQAQGVCLDGDRYAGSLGIGGIFSFQASKCLNCGEGGAILTNDDAFADRAWSLRHYGREPQGTWYEHFRLGWNFRMPEFSAAILNAQLGKLEDQNQRRMVNAEHLYKRLESIDGLTPIELHPKATKRNHYVVILRYDAAKWDGLPRDRFVEALAAEGVPCVSGYSFASFENPLFKSNDLGVDPARYAASCPNARRACRAESVWLLQHLFLGHDTDAIDRTVTVIGKIRANINALK